jgi:hypothetical protein
MLCDDPVKLKFLCAQIALLRGCRDAGPLRRGEPPLDPAGRCDLCGDHPDVGRLLVGDRALEVVDHGDGRVDFGWWTVEDPRDGMFWVCVSCARLLGRDPAALLRQLLAAHGTCRN